MKKIFFPTLAAVLLTACGSDAPQPPVDRDGKIFLENGKLYAATTNFTESQLVDVLTGTEVWVESEHLYYDKDHASSFMKIDQTDAPAYAPATVYAFDKEGTALISDEMTYKNNTGEYKAYFTYTYTIDGKVLTTTRFDGVSERVVVVAADKDRIVVDRKYVYADIEDATRYPTPIGFDRATVCIRTVWKPFVQTSD